MRSPRQSPDGLALLTLMTVGLCGPSLLAETRSPESLPDAETSSVTSAEASSSSAIGTSPPIAPAAARVTAPLLTRDTPDTPAPVPYAWMADGLLPFPSDVFTVRDETTPSGRRVQIPAQLFPESLRDSVPFDGRAAFEHLNHLDGFGPGMPILLAIPARVDPTQLPEEVRRPGPDSPLQLLEVSTGRRLDFRLIHFSRARSPLPTTLVLVQPLERLRNLERYVLVVTDVLRDALGASIPSPPGFQAGLAGMLQPGDLPVGAAPAGPEYLLELGRTLERLGLSRYKTIMATQFTIQSDENFFAQMRARDTKVEVWADQGGYRLQDLRLRRRIRRSGRGASWIGSARLEVLSFIDDRGRVLDTPTPVTVPVRIERPDRCVEQGCPVVIFGHGLNATKDTASQVSDELLEAGFATVGLGAPWHGSYLESLQVTFGMHRNLDLMHGLMVEHILRNVQLAEALRALPPPPLPSLSTHDGRATLPLNPERIFYVGQSLGGICGVTTLALASEIRGGIFDVAGGSAIDMIFDSWVIQIMRPPLTDFGLPHWWQNNRAMILAMYVFNDVDPVGYAPYLSRSPLPGEPRRYVSQQAGYGDGLVPNWTSEKLARSLGIPTLRGRDVAAVRAEEPEGPGLRYFRHTNHWFAAHLELAFPRSGRAAARFMRWTLQRLDEEQPAPADRHAGGP